MILHIPLTIWQKLQLYTELSLPDEVTGIGTIRVLDPENLLVTETFLPRQKTSPAACEFFDGELNQIIYDLIELDPDHGASALRFRWHSHGYGQVFWSSKDESDIDSWDAPWVVNLVMNVHGDSLLRLDYFSPLRVRNHPVKLRIDCPDFLALRHSCQQELDEKLHRVPLVGKQTLVKEALANGLFGSKEDL